MFIFKLATTGARFVPSLLRDKSMWVQSAILLPTLISWLRTTADFYPKPISLRMSFLFYLSTPLRKRCNCFSLALRPRSSHFASKSFDHSCSMTPWGPPSFLGRAVENLEVSAWVSVGSLSSLVLILLETAFLEERRKSTSSTTL